MLQGIDLFKEFSQLYLCKISKVLSFIKFYIQLHTNIVWSNFNTIKMYFFLLYLIIGKFAINTLISVFLNEYKLYTLIEIKPRAATLPRIRGNSAYLKKNFVFF